jgi:hypothetical protein
VTPQCASPSSPSPQPPAKQQPTTQPATQPQHSTKTPINYDLVRVVYLIEIDPLIDFD